MGIESITLAEFIRRAGSVAEAARMLDMTYLTVWRWSEGKAEPSRSMRKLLAEKGVRWP